MLHHFCVEAAEQYGGLIVHYYYIILTIGLNTIERLKSIIMMDYIGHMVV